MFLKELEDLDKQFGPRFSRHHYFSQKKQKLTRAKLRKKLGSDKLKDSQFFLCGPESLMDLSQSVLKEIGISAAAIHREVFVPSASTSNEAISERTESLTIHTSAGHTTTTVAPQQTILEAGLTAGSQLPYSCTMGGCGACKIKLVSGSVSMPEPNCLTKEEKDSGYILGCVAHACGPVTIEVET